MANGILIICHRGLVVISREVGEPGSGRGSDRGVATVVVMEVQPPRKHVAPLGLQTIEPGIRPPIGEYAVEPFYLPVGLRPIGPGTLRHDL